MIDFKSLLEENLTQFEVLLYSIRGTIYTYMFEHDLYLWNLVSKENIKNPPLYYIDNFRHYRILALQRKPACGSVWIIVSDRYINKPLSDTDITSKIGKGYKSILLSKDSLSARLVTINLAKNLVSYMVD